MGESVDGMSIEQQGALLRLMCYAWMATPACTIPDDEQLLARRSMLGERWNALSAPILAEFERVPEEPGRLRHRALYAIQCEREAFRRKQSENGKKGGRPRKDRERPTLKAVPPPAQAEPVPIEKPPETNAEPTENPPLFAGLTDRKPTQKLSSRFLSSRFPSSRVSSYLVRDPSYSKQRCSSCSRRARRARDGGSSNDATAGFVPPFASHKQFLYRADKINAWINARRGKWTPEDETSRAEFEATWGIGYEYWIELRERCEEHYRTLMRTNAETSSRANEQCAAGGEA